MSSRRVPDTEPGRETRSVPRRVSDFIAEAERLTRRGDVPLLPEWTAWAARYETLHEVWRASRNPEFLIFLLGHAVRQDYLEDREGPLDALERFVGWCVANAGLDLQPFRAPDGPLVETSRGWFSTAGASPFGRARRASQVAERAAVGELGTASFRELLEERSEQAAVFRLFVGNPFYGTSRTEEGQVTGACGDRAGHTVESEDGQSGADEGEEDRSDLLLAPAQRGPWGVVTRLTGPPDPPGASGTGAAALRDADGSLRRGMILLSKKSVEDSVALAEECFRDALSLLISTVGEMHPKVAYACDRIGLVCQIQGRGRFCTVTRAGTASGMPCWSGLTVRARTTSRRATSMMTIQETPTSSSSRDARNDAPLDATRLPTPAATVSLS